jgi:hypothetical protein
MSTRIIINLDSFKFTIVSNKENTSNIVFYIVGSFPSFVELFTPFYLSYCSMLTLETIMAHELLNIRKGEVFRSLPALAALVTLPLLALLHIRLLESFVLHLSSPLFKKIKDAGDLSSPAPRL